MEGLKKRLRGIDQKLIRIRKDIGKLANALSFELLEPKIERIESLINDIQNETEIDLKPVQISQLRRKLRRCGGDAQLIQECLEKRAIVRLQRIPMDLPENIEDELMNSDQKPFFQFSEENPVSPPNVIVKKKRGRTPKLVKRVGRTLRRKASSRRVNIKKNQTKERIKAPVRSRNLVNFMECPSCPKKFSSSYTMSFEFHKLTHQIPNLLASSAKLYCPICSKTLHKMYTYRAHVLSHYNIKSHFPYECSHCSKKFISLPIKRNHEKTHDSSGSFPCKVCSMVLKNEPNLVRHMRFFHGPLKCTHCPRTFFIQKNLNKHIKEHESWVICEHCGKSLAQVDLYAHVYQRHLHKCGLNSCTLQFKSNQELLDHQKESHIPQFICDSCGAEFYHISPFKVHIKRAHEQKFTCSWEGCGSKFYSESDFKRHQRRHQREFHTQNELENSSARTYPCDLCGKIYPQHQSLVYHKNNFHAQSNDWVCEFEGCGKSFPTQVRFNQHKLSHEVVECEFCHKICTKVNIRHHILKFHVKERDYPFKCNVEGCGESYSRQKHLELHMQKKHG